MRWICWMTLLCALAVPVESAGQVESVIDGLDWVATAPPLPRASRDIIEVATVDQLLRAVEEVDPGGTILVADGLYHMPRYFEIRTSGVTLRSASGDRERVVLDGSQSSHHELLGVAECSGVTIADLTIQNVETNGFKINSDRFATNVRIYNCVIRNVWQRGVKGPKVRAEDRGRFRPSACRIEYCLFYNDRPKRFADDPRDTAQNFGGNYVGGIDAMYARGWTIADNVFVGIRGRTGEARGAVFLWHESEDCVVERNVIVDCDTGICLGNSHKPDDVPVHCTRCVVRNNFVVRCPENGILADYTRGCTIAGNTIHNPRSPFERSIRIVHDSQGLVVAGNLISGPEPRVETTDRITLEHNRVGDYADLFVRPELGDLHLTAEATTRLGRVPRRADLRQDIDRQDRFSRTMPGADEAFGNTASARPR